MSDAPPSDEFLKQATSRLVEEPACWMWTLLVEDEIKPGGCGGRKTMQIPSFHDDEEGIIREVEGRWKTAVIKIKGKEGLYIRG